jgi:hypothetical protein
MLKGHPEDQKRSPAGILRSYWQPEDQTVEDKDHQADREDQMQEPDNGQAG